MGFLILVWNTIVSAINATLKFATAFTLGIALTIWFLAEGPGTEQVAVPERVTSVFDTACSQREDSFVETTKEWLVEKGETTVDSMAGVESDTKDWYKDTFLPAWENFKQGVIAKYDTVFGSEEEEESSPGSIIIPLKGKSAIG